MTTVGQIVEEMRRGGTADDGTEYAGAIGWISAIARPRVFGRYGTSTEITDTERLEEIGRVLDALDIVTEESR